MQSGDRSKERKSRDILRIGQISSVNAKAAAARTAHDDLTDSGGQPYTAPNMQVLFPAMGKWRMFYTPREGDHVAVLRLPNGIEQGFILGTFYSASNMPLDGADGVIQLVTADGENLIRLNADGTAAVSMKESVSLKAKTLSLESDGMALAAQGVTINAGDVTVKAEKVVITADSIEITGTVKINGSLEVTGDIRGGDGAWHI